MENIDISTSRGPDHGVLPHSQKRCKVDGYSKIYGGVFGDKFFYAFTRQRLIWRSAYLFAFTCHAGSPDDGRAAVAANRLICDQPAKHSGVYGGAFGSKLPHSRSTRAAQQLRSPTGRPRLVARKPSLRSRRPATEGQKNNQSCAAAQEPDRATAPRGAKAKLTE